MLLVGVQTDPLTVQRSVGENSGSLIGPRRVNGVKMVEGDWSIPRLRRYNCKKNPTIRYTNLHGYGIFFTQNPYLKYFHKFSAKLHLHQQQYKLPVLNIF